MVAPDKIPLRSDVIGPKTRLFEPLKLHINNRPLMSPPGKCLYTQITKEGKDDEEN